MKGTLERSEVSASFVKLDWMSKEQRQSSKLLEPRSFDAYKNTTAPMIAMLDHSKIDIEISDTGMEITDSNNYREVSRDDGW